MQQHCNGVKSIYTTPGFRTLRGYLFLVLIQVRIITETMEYNNGETKYLRFFVAVKVMAPKFSPEIVMLGFEKAVFLVCN